MAITKDMSILEVVQKYPDTAEVFMNAGMGCLGCAAASGSPARRPALFYMPFPDRETVLLALFLPL
ncbi:DUF1858 domain-containing protein [uncultured Selenomonas sp.]|uniref:DUF1858 domain-containing protein n=1 Tax=uncultured Selenomonas sp. TaxID=159275 RepID=UPI0025D7FD6F|nr:DUF1858 domain-containing protein [uncultured Selenomonas sp.]